MPKDKRLTWNPSLRSSWRFFGAPSQHLTVFLNSDGKTQDQILESLPQSRERSRSPGLVPDSKRYRDPRLIYELAGLVWEDRKTQVLHLTDFGRSARFWAGKIDANNLHVFGKHAILALNAMQLRNPTREGQQYSDDNRSFPARFIWKAMLQLGGRLSSEEINRGIMKTKSEEDLEEVISRIKYSRNTQKSESIGDPVIPSGPGQNDRIIPWISLASFGFTFILDKRESVSGDYEIRPGCLDMMNYACAYRPAFKEFEDVEKYVQHLSSAARLPVF